jgi:hypothetical protein
VNAQLIERSQPSLDPEGDEEAAPRRRQRFGVEALREAGKGAVL